MIVEPKSTPVATAHVVPVGPVTSRPCTISSWGTAAAGIQIAITANPGGTEIATAT